jgi:hypothetical protein
LPLKKIEIKNPYLNGVTEIEKNYKDELNISITKLLPHLSSRQQKELLEKKLQINSDDFKESQYLQAACEITICSYLAEKFSETFEYEPKLNPPKDVDCSFSEGGTQYNIEIKCADYAENNAINESPSFRIGFFGRMPNIEGVIRDLNQAFEHTKDSKPLVKQQHMDNKLKSFLESAHSKFSPEPKQDQLNILAVCCDTAIDMQKWYSYLFGNEGLFTKTSYADVETYKLVDVVYFTNIYHRHYSYPSKSKISAHWSLDNSFNFIVSNPFRHFEKEYLINRLVNLLPNYSTELTNFTIPGEAEDFIKQNMLIPHFVGDELQARGIYTFQPLGKEDN